ncbi:hypothetical protein ACLK19_05055 [Escherichia coli]
MGRSGLVMLLPHGLKGGAERSSARLEHYLQLCAGQNIQVCVPSPSTVYHMLRVWRCAGCVVRWW